jgi:hypothetical protein
MSAKADNFCIFVVKPAPYQYLFQNTGVSINNFLLSLYHTAAFSEANFIWNEVPALTEF